MSQKITKNDIQKIPNKIFIFDGHYLLYRSYFALKASGVKLYDQKGRPTGAIQGVCNVLMKFLLKYQDSMFCIASDSGGKNFRHEIFSDYKANRTEIDNDLRAQIIEMQNIYKNFGISLIGNHGHEADDYIASFVKKFSKDYTVFIVSADKDLMSLITKNVFMIEPIKEDFFDCEAVEAKFGIGPDFVLDYLSLIGDSSDNIPGVSGIGPKGALKILSYGHIQNSIDQNFENIQDAKLVQKLRANLDDLILSLKLVKMDSNLEINLSESDLRFSIKNNAKKIYETFMDFNLNSLASRIEKFLSFDDFSELKEKEISNDNYQNIQNHFSEKFLNQIYLEGICYMNFIQKDSKDEFILQILLKKDILVLESLSNEDLEKLKILIADSSIKKIVFKIHYGFQEFLKQNQIFEQNGFYDLAWIYFNLIGVRANENFHYLTQYAKDASIDFAELLNKKQIKTQKDYIFIFEELYEIGIKELIKTKQIDHFEIDRKLYKILVQMENAGIFLDKEKLSEFGIEIEKQMKEIEKKIVYETGYEFNIISPKQTSEVLFEKLGIIPVGKKSSKTNLYSTDTKVLEELSLRGEVIADYILEYRSLNKLKTSYCQSLLEKVDPKTGRIHTKFWINGATTGRILSSEPNLQNIPIKTPLGKKIRECFIAKENNVLLSVDYSQIELRILAKLAGVQNLINAFNENKDIHKITASEVFGIPLDEITDFERNKAKAINFGIIYGISPFGLSKQLKIPVSEASMIIKKYFSEYPEIQKYLDETKKFFHENGFVSTMFGRRCYAPHFSISKENDEVTFEVDKKINFAQSQFLERAAINAPIQGTAADILKQAIISSNDLIEEKFRKEIKILLQIHDEIIFEVDADKVDLFAKEASLIMEKIADGIDLNLKAEFNFNKYWD